MLKAIRRPVPTIDYRWTADDGRGGVAVVHPANVGKPVHWAEDVANGIIPWLSQSHSLLPWGLAQASAQAQPSGGELGPVARDVEVLQVDRLQVN